MADTSTTAVTPTDKTTPLDAGHTTTEYKISMIATILGIVATVVGYASVILGALPQDMKWVGTATTIVGLLTSMLTALGYTVTRGAVKRAALAASAASPTTAADVAAKNLAA